MFQNKVSLISHRGGSREKIENTIEAFEKSVNLGANILEMDVYLTLDKKIVVVHDHNLDIICGVDEYVSDLNFD